MSYNKIGGVLTAQGKLPEALDARRLSLKIHQKLADQDRSNTNWQRDLAVSYEKVGEGLMAQGKRSERWMPTRNVWRSLSTLPTKTKPTPSGNGI